MIDSRTIARAFAIGLGVSRVAGGAAELLSGRRLLSTLGAADPGHPGTLLAFRMKGGRDVALGLLTVAARDDDRLLAATCAAAVVIDGVDGLAVAADRGATFGPPVRPLGAILGVGVAVVAVWADRSLRRMSPDLLSLHKPAG